MRWPSWLGVGERRWKRGPDEEVQPPKTLWDLLQLLIVPAMLAAIAIVFSASQASRDRQREDRRIREDRTLADDARKDATLDAYLAQVSSLMLTRSLATAPPDSAVRKVARIATLSTVRRLDGRRRGEVVRFLAEAGLLSQPPAARHDAPGAISLQFADLRGATLTNVNFSHVSLAYADLRRARFDDADLEDTSFIGSDLTAASFRRAFIFISGTWFTIGDLTRAVFNDAAMSETDNEPHSRNHLERTCLTGAKFVGASLFGADFTSAWAHNIDFSNAAGLDTAQVRDAQFANVRMHGSPAKERPRGWGPSGPQLESPSAANCPPPQTTLNPRVHP